MCAIAVITLNGCDGDSVLLSQQEPEKTKQIDLNFNITDVSGNIDKNTLKNIRIIAVDTKTGLVVFNESKNYSTDKIEENIIATNIGFTVNVKPGQYNFMVIANQKTELNELLNKIVNENDIKNIAIKANDYKEDNLLLLQKVDNVMVRQGNVNPSLGEISLDGGEYWMPDIPIALNRLAAKVSLKMRKNESNNGNQIKIVNASICQIPKYMTLIPEVYREIEYDTKTIIPNNMITLPDQDDKFIDIFSNTLISENILSDPDDNTLSTFIKITALHNGVTVTYTTMLGQWNGTKSDYDNFNVVRNTHYEVLATLTTEGVFVNEIVMSVVGWFNSNNDVDLGQTTPIYKGEWNEKVEVDNKNVTIHKNEVVEYKFKLTGPKNAIWRAHIDNTLDFEFDNREGKSFGEASDEEQIIRIKPRKTASINDKCQFHITVNNKEIDIDNNGIIGRDDRFIIIVK